MKLLYVFDKGANCKYWEAMLSRTKAMYSDFEYTICRLRNYMKFNQDKFDVIVYQTFPDENHRWKFEKVLVEETDKKFLSFNGPRVLFDSKDGTNDNGFSRFGTDFPRIKHVGGKKYSEKFNTILVIPGALYQPVTLDIDRTILVHYSPSMRAKYRHEIRKMVFKLLQNSFSEETNFIRISKHHYSTFLNTVLISITVPGYGDVSGAAYYSLLAGSCLFAHEWMNHLKLLPHSDLIDGEDFVSFNLDNFETKLRELLNNRDRTLMIGRSGRGKFIEGMSLDKSCEKMYSALKCLN